MNKVYIVTERDLSFRDYPVDRILGVYATREVAEAKYIEGLADLEIEEYEVETA